MNLIETAVQNGQTALSEYQSKQFLQAFNIPVTREELAQSADEAVTVSEKIGFPVALKACSPELLHKTEAGCISLGLKTARDVEQAYLRIVSETTVKLEGVLVQEMVSGSRELVVGLTRDPQFGPCVLLGFGGVMTEIIRDTVFRAAPFDKIEAMDMIDELRSRAMLDAFRGQQAADLDMICRALMAVGQIGLQYERIAEIDINPLIVAPDGRIKAVDALIILKEKGTI